MFALWLFISIAVSCYGAGDVDSYLKICSRSSPDVNDCLVDAVQAGIAAMADGINEIGIPSLDPYVQKELKLEYKNNQIQAKMINKNIRVLGLKDSTVRDVRLRAEDDSFHLEIDMYTPAVTVSGDYKGSGSFNDLTFVNAQGMYITNMTDLVYTWKLDGKPETINDEVYMRITAFDMRPDVTNMYIHLTNDAPETKDLTDLGVRLVNENWRLMYKELLPLAQNNWNKIGIKVANKIFLKMPYNRLFPNN